MTKDRYRSFSASLRDSTREALDSSARLDNRSAAKHAEVLILEALEARAAKTAETAASRG